MSPRLRVSNRVVRALKHPRPIGKTNLLLAMPAYYAYVAYMKTKQYTVRGISPLLDRRLRQQAKAQNKSLNAVAVEALRKASGLNEAWGAAVYDDMDDLIGSWKSDPATDAAFAQMRSIDGDLWK